MIATASLGARSGIGLLLFGLGLSPCVAQDPSYIGRLELPISEDAIGYPRAVTADPHTGELFVCDTRNNRILIFDETGVFRYQISGGRGFSSPIDLAVDRDGFLFVLAYHDQHAAVVQLDFDGTFVREVAVPHGEDIALPPTFGSIAISVTGDRLYLIDDANMLLWITDRAGRPERRVDLAPGVGPDDRQDLIVGKVDVFGDRVVVALASTGQIHLLDPDGELLGRHGISGAARCQLGFPTAASLDADGNLVILDQQRMVLVRWSPQERRCLGEAYGLGAAPGYLYFPIDLAHDRAGRIYATQGYEGRVQVYEGLPPAAALPASAEAAVVPGDPRVEAERAVRDWARSRVEQRVDDHLDAYAADYLPWGFGDRPTWELFRRSQLARDQDVEIELFELRVEPLSEDTARATFVENLVSQRYSARVRKVLLLVVERGAWRILEERADPLN